MTNCFIKEINPCIIDEDFINTNSKVEVKDCYPFKDNPGISDSSVNSKTICKRKKSNPDAKPEWNCPPFTPYIYCCKESDTLKKTVKNLPVFK
jgi:hypothetical protein